MGVVTVQLTHASLVDLPTILLAAASLVALLRFRLDSSWLILGGALAGVLIRAGGLS